MLCKLLRDPFPLLLFPPVTGSDNPGGSDTNENRGYLLSGYCNNVTGNSGHSERARFTR